MKFENLPMQTLATPRGQNALQLRPQRRIEPAIHDRIGEGGGHGHCVAEPQKQEECALLVFILGLKRKKHERY